jgi:hypothetical protein
MSNPMYSLTREEIASIDWHIQRIAWLSREIYLLSVNEQPNGHCISELDEHIIALREYGFCKDMPTKEEVANNVIID